AFPTAAFLGGLTRGLGSGGAPRLGRAADLKIFLDAHDSFELLSTPIDKFLDGGKGRTDLAALTKDDGFRAQLKARQRGFKVAPTFAATNALLADGVHSAQKIYRMGHGEFVKRYAAKTGMSVREAQHAWSKAADTHAAVLSIVGDLKSFDSEGVPLVLNNGNA